MHAVRSTSLLLATAVLASGCYISFGDAEPGSGVSATEKRELETFDQVSLSGSGDVNVKFGEAHSVELTTDDNLIELINTEVVDGRLKIKPKKNINPTIWPTFDIVTEQLSAISISGSAEVNIDSYEGDELALRVSGSGSFKVTGECELVSLNISGSGDADLTDLVAQDVEISISGSGNAQVNAVKNLSVSVAGSGDVGYLGDPQVKKSISGSGDVHKIKK